MVGGAIPASAKPPAREVFRNEGWFTLPDIPCDGFMHTEEMDSESVQVTTFFNKAGDPIKESNKANFFGTITNSLSGNTYRDHATFTETCDLVDGTTAVSGQSYHYIVKWKGQVFAEVGHEGAGSRPLLRRLTPRRPMREAAGRDDVRRAQHRPCSPG